MLLDLRTYRVSPGRVSEQLDLYAKLGFDVQRRHLGEPMLYGVAETGDVNSYVHLWRYQDAADREERRAALQSDPAWAEYREQATALGYQIAQNNVLLKPAKFWRL